PNVQLYGGFDPLAEIRDLDDERIFGSLDSLQNGTILSGDFNQNDLFNSQANHSENALHVTIVAGDLENAKLDGFTITGGHATGGTTRSTVFGRTFFPFNGGGTYISSSALNFSNIIWVNNFGQSGGGVYIGPSEPNTPNTPIFEKVTFYANRTFSGGGGIRSISASFEIRQGLFANNISGHQFDPTSSGSGGAIYSYGNNNTAKITNTTFFNNSFIGYGPTGTHGGALFINGTETTLANNIFWQNTTSGDSESSFSSYLVQNAVVNVKNSLIPNSGGSGNGQWDINLGVDGGGNKDKFPQFITTNVGSSEFLHLSNCSPAVNAGDNSSYTASGGNLLNDTDLSGNERVFGANSGGVIDMGPFEFKGNPILIQSLDSVPTVRVPIGTTLTEIIDRSLSMKGHLQNGDSINLSLMENLANWTLISPAGGQYDGNVAETYEFLVPVIIPEGYCLQNGGNVLAKVTVIVGKGLPEISILWNNQPVDTAQGLNLSY